MADESTPATPSSETPPPRTTGGGFRWEPPTAEELQALMPGYTIEKILGRGGMGAVYRGVQTNLDRPVAIKILPPGVEKEDPSFAERFKSEARLMAKLSHPAVVGVYDFGTNLGGQLYFAMEYVDGSDVSQMIAAQGKLPPEHALAITAHVCDALQAAHELGIVHRDIKPANVLLNMKGQVKVADFGLAKVEDPGQHGLTKTGYAMGTPDFVAPEALMLGTAIDGRADLYAVGVMLYQMLTGNIPRGAFKPASVLVPGLDPRFDPIILKAMQHDREERHQSAAELRRELDVILTVPFVRNDAPVSAAIPVAQVAEVPGQRSAAQKPVGKPPQPKSDAGTSARNSSSGGAATKHEAGKSARAPLLIGFGIAAAVAIGAFFMFGGSKKTPPAAVGDRPPPSKPASVASSNPKPAASTPPTPKPAAASTSSVSQSSAKFPPGQWVKVFTKLEDLPPALRSRQSSEMKDGWIKAEGTAEQLHLPSGLTGNYAIRALFRYRADNKLASYLNLRVHGSDKQRYQLFLSDGGFLSLQSQQAGKFISLASVQSQQKFKLGETFQLSLGVVGARLVMRLGSELMRSHVDASHASGSGFLHLQDDVRDIEVINLDGLPEAEALKILGVDEKGNDLRQPAPSVVQASGLPPKLAAGATAPTSSSPSPPASKSSEQQFPPGQWVRVFTKFEELPEHLRKLDCGVKFENGWLSPASGKSISLTVGQFPQSTNQGIRLTYKVLNTTSFTGEIRLRQGNGSYVMGVGQTVDLYFNTGVANNFERVRVSEPVLCREWASGKLVVVEFAIVGTKMFGWVNDRLVVAATDARAPSGRPELVNNPTPVGDIEVINLDGLPETEALRILGVDEKGNDLRALAAKQEQQMAEQAKVADAMAAIPELKVLHEQFVKLQGERVTAPFEAEVAKLNAGYLGGIDREIANEKKAGHLDGVIALEAEKKLIQGVGASGPQGSGGPEAPTPCPLTADDDKTTASLKALRAIYRDAYAKLEATRAANLKALSDPLDLRLKQLESSLTQQNRVPDAKTVREYREGLGKEGSAVTPDRNSTTGGAAAKSDDAGKSAATPAKYPKGDDRKAAEWVLNSGGLVKIDDGRGLQTITSVEAVPKKSFELHEINLKGKNGQPAPEISNLTPVAGLQSLRRIMLTGAQITDGDTDLLASCPLLQHMDLAYTTKFTGAEAAKLAQSGNFQELTAGCSALSGEGIRRLSEISSLVRLNFGKCKITDTDIAPLNRLKKLISLRLHQTMVTLEGWRQIKDLPLTEIGFHSEAGRMASDCRELAILFPRTQLVEFLSNSPITAEGVAALGSFDNLNRLVLTSSHINDAVLEALAGLKDITELQIKSQDTPITEATDQGLAQLLKLNSLNHLHIEKFDSLSPAIFTILTRHKGLRKLTIRSCPQLTETAINLFKKARPDVTVVR